MTIKRFILAFLSVIVIGMLIATTLFYLNQQTDSRQSVGKLVAVRIGYIPIADCAQLYVAIEKGFFAEEGLDVNLVSLAGGATILEALGAKSIDIGFSNVVSLILAHDAGLPFVAITGGPVEDQQHPEHAILVRNDSPVKNVSDLRGKKIALNTRRNIDELMVTKLLEKHAVKREDVTFVEVPFPRMLSVLDGGDVDAAAVIEPFVTFGLDGSKNRVLSYNYLEIQPVTVISTFVVRQGWADANRETVAAFRRAISKATTFANNNPDDVRSIVAKYTRLERDQLQGVGLPAFTDRLSKELLNQMIAEVAELGWIKSKFNADAVVH